MARTITLCDVAIEFGSYLQTQADIAPTTGGPTKKGLTAIRRKSLCC
jgi:hypothetical protein